jgi:hypothetical protein
MYIQGRQVCHQNQRRCTSACTKVEDFQIVRKRNYLRTNGVWNFLMVTAFTFINCIFFILESQRYESGSLKHVVERRELYQLLT